PPANGARRCPPAWDRATPMQPGARSPAAKSLRKARFVALSGFFQQFGARPAENPCRASDPLHRARESLPIAKSVRVVRADRAGAPVLRQECSRRALAGAGLRRAN